jgi:hypothetical protein
LRGGGRGKEEEDALTRYLMGRLGGSFGGVLSVLGFVALPWMERWKCIFYVAEMVSFLSGEY